MAQRIGEEEMNSKDLVGAICMGLMEDSPTSVNALNTVIDNFTFENAIRITAVGSRVTCNPAPTDTDRDYLLLIHDHDWMNLYNSLFSSGWVAGGSNVLPWDSTLKEEDKFVSFTCGEDNIIATSNEIFHQRFLAATSVAKRFNLMAKDDRIALFQSVLYGNESVDAF